MQRGSVRGKVVEDKPLRRSVRGGARETEWQRRSGGEDGTAEVELQRQSSGGGGAVTLVDGRH